MTNTSKHEDRGMKELTPSARPKPPQTSKAPGRSPIQVRDIGAFFASMKSAFPMWNIEPTEANISQWHTELNRYTVADLRRAYSSIIDAGGKSPPTLGEVKAACRARPSMPSSPSSDESSARVPKKKAAENVARLKRLLAGLELEPAKCCPLGHLAPLMQARLRESVAGFPLSNGYAIDPAYIKSEERRTSYEAEITAWREAN